MYNTLKKQWVEQGNRDSLLVLLDYLETQGVVGDDKLRRQMGLVVERADFEYGYDYDSISVIPIVLGRLPGVSWQDAQRVTLAIIDELPAMTDWRAAFSDRFRASIDVIALIDGGYVSVTMRSLHRRGDTGNPTWVRWSPLVSDAVHHQPREVEAWRRAGVISARRHDARDGLWPGHAVSRGSYRMYWWEDTDGGVLVNSTKWKPLPELKPML